MAHLAYRFALDPTPAQARALRSHAGAARMVFNWGLARVRANLAQRQAERSYGLTETELTPPVSTTLYSLRKAWNAAKDGVAPWWRSVAKEAFNTGLDRLARALKAWADSRKGNRKGRRVGFPHFKTRKAHSSIRFTTGAIRCEHRHAVLPRIGRVKPHEDGSRLARLVQAGKARILSVAVRLEHGRWFASFVTEAEPTRAAPADPDAVVGIDLGIKTLAVTSAGDRTPNPRHLDRSLRRLRHQARTLSRRQGPDRRSGQQPSKRWCRAAAALAKAEARVANQRRDALHKTTTALTGQYGTLMIEDLAVAAMRGRRRLARRVADAAFGEFRRQLEYKAAWRGGRVIVADRWFASSKTCSGCGQARAKLALSERTYRCASCGLTLDRDLNAARNLAAFGQQILAGSGPESNGRGADHQTRSGEQVAPKRQPGTVMGQTGTVPTQDGTATGVVTITPVATEQPPAN